MHTAEVNYFTHEKLATDVLHTDDYSFSIGVKTIINSTENITVIKKQQQYQKKGGCEQMFVALGVGVLQLGYHQHRYARTQNITTGAK
jgi:hypothetical protein